MLGVSWRRRWWTSPMFAMKIAWMSLMNQLQWYQFFSSFLNNPVTLCFWWLKSAVSTMTHTKSWILIYCELYNQSQMCLLFDLSPKKLSWLQATEGMRSSRFCLHLAGDTPSSCRLFDIIVSHCVPVIISDRIELPFEDDLDYSEFSVFFSAEEAVQPGLLLGTLRSINEERWLQMWEKLKAIAHHFEYQYPAKQDDAVNMIFKQVHRKVSTLKLSVHRSERLRVADWLRRWWVWLVIHEWHRT